MTNTRAVLCGSIAIDRIMNFTGSYADLIEPSKLDVLSVSVLVDSLNIAAGGTGANIAYSLGALGEKPMLLGSVGHDANDYIQRLSSAGVDTAGVHTSDVPTASFSVLTDNSGNQVGGFYPGAMADAESLGFTPFAGQNVIVCLSAHDPNAMRRQVAECAEHKLRLMYDPGQQVSNISGEDLQAGIAAAEVVIVNEYELDVMSKKTGISAEELEKTVPFMIITQGAAGSTVVGKNIAQPIKIASALPAKVVDPTGAGDAYRAGFLYGYLRQWEVHICGQLGAVVASFVLEQAGTQVPLSTANIIKRYQTTFNEEITL